MPDYTLERAAGGIVAGVDEAGRGPLAGPVMAGAAILDPDTADPTLLAALDDSKKLSEPVRVQLYAALCQSPGVTIATGEASVEEIDCHNILQATFLAMQRALTALNRPVDLALIDGNRTPVLTCPARAVVKGDNLSWSIAAASIAAKVTRDARMTELAGAFPGYGWENNAGYGTAAHRAALVRLGPTPHHRRSFAPVRALLSPAEGGAATLL